MFADDLRDSILQEAIQGKLVPQDPNDEPAEELVKRIRAEKQRLIKEKKIKKEKNVSEIYRRDGSWYETIDGKDERCIDDEIPFEIPEFWTWVRLDQICETIVDCPHSTPKYVDYNTGYCALDTNCFDKQGIISKFRYLQHDEYEVRTSRLVPQSGDVIFSREGVVGYAAIIPPNMNICLGQRVMLFRPSIAITSDYLRMVLSHHTFINILLSKTKGIGVKHINVKDVIRQIVPIPSLEEQKRIINTLSEIDENISLFKEKETCYVNYQQSFPMMLKDSIISEAVRGKLFPHDQSDEPAEELVKRIRAEKQRLIKEKKIKKEKNVSEIYRRDGSWYEIINGKKEICIDDEIPFDIPESWIWCRLNTVVIYDSGININTSEISDDSFFVELENIEKDTGRLLSISKKPARSVERNSFREGDILYSKLRPYLNKVIIAPFDGYSSTELVSISIVTGMDVNYLHYYLMSPFFVTYAVNHSYGVKMPRVGTDDVKNALIPVPPFEEQRMISGILNDAISQINDN